MTWEFDANKPIYLQLMETIKAKIMTGEFPPGSKLPSVRDLAKEAGVNPNTMQRALAQLETENLLCTERTNGRFVSDNNNLIADLQTDLAQETTHDYLEKMATLGYDVPMTVAFININNQ